jgi:hypothetical protein
MRHVTFAAAWLFVAAVSAYDTYLTVLYAKDMVEQNPFGCYLIRAGGVPLLIAVKFFGTSVALAALLGFYQRGRLCPQIVTGAVVCQLLLLLYLVFA